jgi:4-amino-4-deoxy-L-arabinose transferase-like glycosyltransferase
LTFKKSHRQYDSDASPTNSTPTSGTKIWLVVVAIFLIGLIVRVEALEVIRPVGQNQAVRVSRWHPTASRVRLENDESIYLALVEQLDAGRGYTLRGHPILNQPWIDHEQYDQALFFHPPGGIALFWALHTLVGESGLAWAQVLSFAIFFWSVMSLGETVLAPTDGATRIFLAMSAAFTPIMAQVAGRLWLDGPLLAFSTLAWAVFIRGQVERKSRLIWIAGALLGFASLIKLTAVLVVPSVIASSWCLTPRSDRRRLIVSGLIFVGVAALMQVPWALWQWTVMGAPFSALARKPVAALVASNRYVHYLTVVRRPWAYLELVPQVIWTAVPSLVLLGLQWRNRFLRTRGIALLIGIAAVVGVNIALGAIGYSKVLRYVILISPAMSLLFALVAGAALRAVRDARYVIGGKPVVIALLILAAVGQGLEILQSLKTSFVDSVQSDLIIPLTGLRDGS